MRNNNITYNYSFYLFKMTVDVSITYAKYIK